MAAAAAVAVTTATKNSGEGAGDRAGEGEGNNPRDILRICFVSQFCSIRIEGGAPADIHAKLQNVSTCKARKQ